MICLSFDDGRKDTYSIAYPIMKQYGLVGTVHVTTGFVDGSWKGEDWPSAASGAMSIEEVKELWENGFEITSHGDRHITQEEDMRQSIYKLKNWGVIENQDLAFSVPHSLVPENSDEIYSKCQLTYVRSGRAKACYKLWRKGAYMMQALTHSKYFFYLFNKPNVMQFQEIKPYALNATVIKKHNTANQLIYFLNKTDTNDVLNILMFHSILGREDKGYGKDDWYFDQKEFEKLCRWLEENRKGQVVTIKEGVNRCLQKSGHYQKVI